MSNSRRYRRSVVAVTAAGALASAGALVGLTAQTAFAFMNAPNVTTAPATNISAGVNNQSAAPFVFNTVGSLNTGDSIRIEVQPPNATYSGTAPFPVLATHANESLANDYIGFASVPSVTVTPATGNTGTGTAPTVSAALSYDTADGAGASTVMSGDILTLTVTNGGTISSTDSYSITVGGISYNVGSATPIGNAKTLISTTNAGGATSPLSTANDAAVTQFTVTTSAPPVGIPTVFTPAAGVAVPDVILTESVAGGLHTGNLVLTAPTHFTFVNLPTASASGGNGAITSGTLSSTTTATYAVTASTAGATTYTFSNIQIANTSATPASTGTHANITITYNGALTTAAKVGAVTLAQRIYGQSADDTAAALFQSGAANSTIASVPGQTATSTPGVANAVLATDASYSDALAANYLAGALSTGIVLTSPDSLPASTLNALRLENVQTVYVVGGPLAVNPSVVAQLQSTQAYFNGAPEVNAGGNPVDLQVVRIGGQTLYDTDYNIATYFGQTGQNLQTNIAGAYGDSTLNDTTGNASTTAPLGADSAKTAILATGTGFQDAMSAGPLSYYYNLPIILTDGSQPSLSPQAVAAIANLGITQMLVLGGPLAVPNSVVTQLQAEGVSVVRIAGNDYTDTSVKLANYLTGSNYQQDSYGVISVARGDYWADGLAGGPVAGSDVLPIVAPQVSNGFGHASGSGPEPIILTNGPGNLGTYTTNYLTLQAAGGTSGNIIYGSVALNVFGGPLAVTPTDLQNVENAIAAGRP